MTRAVGILILLWFYGVYLGKMRLQKRQGIQTDQMARGEKRDRVFYTELTMKIATYLAAAVSVGSVFFAAPSPARWARVLGGALGLFGDGVFTAAVLTMRDSWRAGLAADDSRGLVTGGIYRWSRNPAFLGFDCMYAGITLLFFNVPMVLAALWAGTMLHLQILQEEAFLPGLFGEEYIAYKRKVCRYLGRK